MEDGGWRMEDGGWRIEVSNCRPRQFSFSFSFSFLYPLPSTLYCLYLRAFAFICGSSSFSRPFGLPNRRTDFYCSVVSRAGCPSALSSRSYSHSIVLGGLLLMS